MLWRAFDPQGRTKLPLGSQIRFDTAGLGVPCGLGYSLPVDGHRRRRVSLSDSPKRTAALTLFGVQLAANFLWSLVFFNLQAFGFAFFWLIVLWVLILIMTLLFARVDRIAAWLQLPYLLWVIFAGYLNCLTWLLNR